MNRREEDGQVDNKKETLKSKGNVFIGTFALLIIVAIILVLAFLILLYMSFANS